MRSSADEKYYFSRMIQVKELEENIRDAYGLMMKERQAIRRRAKSKPIAISA